MTLLPLDCAPAHQVWYPHSFSPGVHLCLASVSTKLFLYVISHLCYVSNDKFCICIYSFCLCDKCIFHWRQWSMKKNSLQPLALASLLARIPHCHPGYPGSIPGQGIKMPLHTTTHCWLTRSVPLGRVQVLTLALNGWHLDRASISQSGRSLSCFLGAQPHRCGSACIQNIFPPHSRYQQKWDAFPPNNVLLLFI